MIVVQLKGGLGNQMFQYAIGNILGKKYKQPVFLDLNFFRKSFEDERISQRHFELNVFKNQYKIADDSQLEYFRSLSFFNRARKKIGLRYPRVIVEKNFGYHSEILFAKGPVYLKGYFQSYRYFKDHSHFIVKKFQFKKLDEGNLRLLNLIRNNNSVSVHIRRGDYVTNTAVQEVHSSCGPEYYKRAIEKIKGMVPEVFLVFFSDDMGWVKENFSDLPENILFVDNNSGIESWKDLCLMSQCKHNIIANSSFSWWGAWLNQHPLKTVIAPEKWFNDPEMNSLTNDLIPEEWLRM